MGIKNNLISFEEIHIADKDLILRMLRYEDALFLSKAGQTFLHEYGMNITSLEGCKSIQRMTLNNFGFQSMESDLKRYRTIFHHYYKSSADYDSDILNAVFYMRENKCLYYKTAPIELGVQMPNTNVYGLDGMTSYDLHQWIRSKNYSNTFVAAFSLS